jgi:uncharacterized LabA/DUF88 family protein
MNGQSDKTRVIAYIDGFNLYYGLCDSGFRKYLWLNLQGMVQALLRPEQELVCTKYFTARISGGRPSDRPTYRSMRDAKRKRQATFLDALGTLSDLRIYYGQYLDDSIECRRCGAKWMDAEEKMTDVNIATEMLVDAFANRYDEALLVSADSDLVPPLRAIKDCFPHKRISVAFPPKRSSVELLQVSDRRCVIYKNTIRDNQFSRDIKLASGYVLQKPTDWS